MRDPFRADRTNCKKRNPLLRTIGRLDAACHAAAVCLAGCGREFNIFFRRFSFAGAGRVGVEITGEAVTLCTAGMITLLALALPAMQTTSGGWPSRDDPAITFLDRYGNEIGHRGIIREDSVPLDQLPDHLIKAVLATEDRRFFHHFGIDFVSVVRALTENVRANSVVQGGSTITQQLAKNLFLTSERTIERKIKEVFLALWLEANMSKTEILQLYLDRAYMGGGVFGIAAAVRFYFGKDVKDATLAEAAILAGLFKAPTRYAPHINLQAARERANQVLSNLVQSGLMTEGQVIGARRNPASIVRQSDRRTPDYFLDWVFEEVRHIVGDNPDRPLIVRTTIDTALQQAAEETLNTGLDEFGERYKVNQGSIVLIENGGAIRAMVGGRDYGESQFNRVTRARRQPGSSFKVFVYIAAMENGFTPETKIRDAPITWRGWSPRNYRRDYLGRIDLTHALVKSVNTVPIRLARDHVSTEAIAEVARRLGVSTPIRSDKTMPLGTSEVTLLDMATAYSVLPAGGLESNRHGIVQIIDFAGNVLYDRRRDAPQRKRLLSVESAEAMNSILAQVPVWGTGQRARIKGIRTAGKTGTTQAYRDAWFIGYTGNYTAAVWFGNDDYSPSASMTGSSLPAIVFKRLMSYAHQGVELESIPGFEEEDAKESAKIAVGGRFRRPVKHGKTGARPWALSNEATRLLHNFSDRFANAPPITERQPLSVSLTPTTGG